MRYRTIDLCAGIGGIRKGFERTKHFKNVKSAEIDEYAARTYEANFNGDDPRNDLTSKEFKASLYPGMFDVLLAGFPCQPFSSQGNKEGFGDPTKGTIFFHLKQIINKNRPKVIFLENVQNIISHDGGNTIHIILDSLEKKLDYRVIGVEYDEKGDFEYDNKSFVRNTKDFGLPQNRPRAYFIAFDRKLYGGLLKAQSFPKKLPEGLSRRVEKNRNLGKRLTDIIEPQVDLHYFMSKTYLETLKNHKTRQKNCGNGYGYCILNDNNVMREYANTILATGGSGKERNLIIQPMPPHDDNDPIVDKKKGGLNEENVRIMTPTEWGRLQGFIGYAFINEETGADEFHFPENVPESQQYKQFGNSVSIPVIETMAEFIYTTLKKLNENDEAILRNYESNYGIITEESVKWSLNIGSKKANALINDLLNRGILKQIRDDMGVYYQFL